MNARTKGQIAELIDDSIVARGFKGTTAPFLWLRMLYGPLFERNVPMNAFSVREVRFLTIFYLGMLPLIREPRRRPSRHTSRPMGASPLM